MDNRTRAELWVFAIFFAIAAFILIASFGDEPKLEEPPTAVQPAAPARTR